VILTDVVVSNTQVVHCAGGVVVVRGGTYHLTGVSFRRCTIGVMSGAKVKMKEVGMDTSSHEISIRLHGAGTEVQVQQGTVHGGKHGVLLECVLVSRLMISPSLLWSSHLLR
jgi:hypothetical protein